MKNLRVSIRHLLDRLRVRPTVHDRLAHWVHGPEFRRWCRSHSCNCVQERIELYQFLAMSEGLNDPIDYLEFGVSRGRSMRWWVESSLHPDSTFVGFDTFEGLPEEWAGWQKGVFSADGKAPEILDPRCSFVKGLFQDTLPAWLAGREFTRRTVLHLDADLYTSTLMVLTQLLPKLKNGDIMIFDEFDNYLHEYRALIDATTAYRRSFVPLCHTPNWEQVAFKLT